MLQPITIGVVAGLVLGKPIGVFGTTFVLAKFSRASLDDDLAWRDVFGVSLLAGIGFTVSLLIGELAFGHGTDAGVDGKMGVLCGSVVAALLAAVVLLSRNAAYRRIHDIETARRRPRRCARRLRHSAGLTRGSVRRLAECLNRSAVPPICST